MRASVLLGDIERAELALQRLRSVADAIRTAPLRAAASMGEGLVARARGEHVEARRHLERAVVGYGRGHAPYEAAIARLELADTLGALGHAALADGQRTEALAVLERLGVDRREAGPEDPLTAREREVLLLMGGGAGDREIAERLGISEHTVHRHAANVRGKLGVSSRAAAIAHVAHRT